MPANLATLRQLLARKHILFSHIIRKNIEPTVKAKLVHDYVHLRSKCILLTEELNLRSRHIVPNMKQLEQYTDHMEKLQWRITELTLEPSNAHEYKRLQRELQKLIAYTQKSPHSLHHRCNKFRKHHNDYENVKHELSHITANTDTMVIPEIPCKLDELAADLQSHVKTNPN